MTDIEIRANVSANLKRALRVRKMSQRELCRLANIPPTSLSPIIRGEVIPGLSIAVRLSEALDTSVDKIVSTPTEKKSK